MALLSNVYNVSRDLRGEAVNGWIRPTLKQYFMTLPLFEQIESLVHATIPLTETADGKHSISSDGLVITKLTSTSTFTYSVCDSPISSGKYYFEVTFSSHLGDIIVLDDFDSTRVTSGSIAGAYRADSWGAYNSGGEMYEATSSIGLLTSNFLGTTMGVALDMDNKTLKFYKNILLGTVGTSGIPLPNTVYVAFDLYAPGSSIVLNFGQIPFIYSVPSGYMSGLMV